MQERQDKYPERLQKGVQECSLLRRGIHRRIKVAAGTRWAADTGKASKQRK